MVSQTVEVQNADSVVVILKADFVCKKIDINHKSILSSIEDFLLEGIVISSVRMPAELTIKP
ncbi:MAG: hypothetical protein OFPI_10670 [Osedax symbiont Rs2]|nr:MAG: hypothetical protein OFPI_10670 [Osedax symbiont Rs2]